MDASSPPSDAERELYELRARAYGPHPDIQTDPAALARLAELETAHLASAPDGADTEMGESASTVDGAPADDSASTGPGAEPPDSTAGITTGAPAGDDPTRSLWHRLHAARVGRRSVAAGALVAVLAIAYTVAWLVGPHPDATLRPAAEDPDRVVFSLIEFLGVDADRSTVRGYEPFRGVEPWFLVDEQGFHCFMLIQRPIRGVDGANCVPPGVDLVADIGSPLYGEDDTQRLPDGSVVRFHYRGDSVDVFVYPAREGE